MFTYIHIVKSFDDIVKTKCSFLFYSSKYQKSWHNVNKHKVDLLLNKEGSIILFYKSKKIFTKQLKHISIYLIVI